MTLDEIKTQLTAHLAKTHEWLLTSGNGKSFALTGDECELSIERDKILFSFQSDQGFQTWRVINYKIENERIKLDLSKNFGTEKSKIEIVPRTSIAEFSAAVEIARIEKANKIARTVVENESGSKLVRVSLKHENARLAHIILENRQKRQTIVFHDVSDTLSPERILTTAILEFEKLQRRKKNAIEKVHIAAEKKIARSLQKILAMLKGRWQTSIKIFEISSDKSESQILTPLSQLEISDLWRSKSAKASVVKNLSLSETAQKIIAFAPGKIDAVYTKHGETLRFSGLPFVRVRRVAGEEKAWFGIESKRQILNEESLAEFLELIENLKTYRCFDTPNKRHALYTLAPEAWLESSLRRNIKQLDANVILSPIHNQFRTGRDKIDLLALRKDGRLIVIELKTSIDREIIFQSADYWRKIEIERRRENLQKAKIFGDLKIKNEPSLIYLVAPLLAFHRDFDFLAQTIAPEIEIYRFDLNENWRERLRVIRQEKTRRNYEL